MAAASRSRDRWKSTRTAISLNANFPVYSPSEGDKTSLKAERGADGVVKVTMRGDVFDGRGFLKSAISGKEADPKSKTKNIDFDVDLKLGAVAGFNGEALRSVDAKMSRRGGVIRNFALNGKARARHAVDRGLRGRGKTGTRGDLSRDQRRRRVPPLHRHLLQGDRRPASLGDGAADGRTQRQGRPDQRPRFLGQGRGRAGARRRRRAGGRAERRGVLARCARNSPGRAGSSRSARASSRARPSAPPSRAASTMPATRCA